MADCCRGVLLGARSNGRPVKRPYSLETHCTEVALHLGSCKR